MRHRLTEQFGQPNLSRRVQADTDVVTVNGELSRHFGADGGNLESPADTCRLIHPTDQFGVSPAALNLGPIQDNGGATLTHALLAGSVAVDAGNGAQCPAADQRDLSPGGGQPGGGPLGGLTPVRVPFEPQWELVAIIAGPLVNSGICLPSQGGLFPSHLNRRAQSPAGRAPDSYSAR